MSEDTIHYSASAAPAPGPADGRAADFSSRCMALLIDWVFLTLLAGCSFFLIARLATAPPAADWRNFLLLLGTGLFVLLVWPLFLSACYFIILHSFGGQTLGKVFMGIKVVAEDGMLLPVGASFLRLVGYLLSILPLGAGFLWAAVDKDHAAWHDKLACSRVIYL
jgi:uncharacterized RDD family membrane protein YckC